MGKRSRWKGCALFGVVGLCGVGGLLTLGLGRFIVAKAGTIGQTTQRAKELGLITDPAQLRVDVPPNDDARRRLSILQKKFSSDVELARITSRLRRNSVIYIAGYATNDEWSRLEATLRRIGPTLTEMRAIAAMPGWSVDAPTNDPKFKSPYPANSSELVQELCLAAIVEARRGDAREAQADLDLAARAMRLVCASPSAWTLYSRLYEEIVILRAAEQCVRALGRQPSSLVLLEDVEARTHELNLRESLRGQPALDGLLIDSDENKPLREAPLGAQIRDLYRASINEYWNKAYRQIPTDLDDLDEAEKVFKSMRRTVRQSPIIMNGATAPVFLVDMARDLLARRRLHHAAIEVLRGQPIRQIDPYSGKTLRTVSRDGHTVIYSFGRDRTDDGGRPRGRGPTFIERYDLIFMLPAAQER